MHIVRLYIAAVLNLDLFRISCPYKMTDRQTDGQTDGQGDSYIYTLQILCSVERRGGLKREINSKGPLISKHK